MYKPVYVPFAVTQHGERVEPKTATQEDYDTLLCEFCRLKISVVIDELTGVKSFVHTPLRLEATMRLTTCPYNKTASKFGDGQKAEYGPLPPVKPANLPAIQRYKTGSVAGAISVGMVKKYVRNVRTGYTPLLVALNKQAGSYDEI